jgi:hypothetical protein
MPPNVAATPAARPAAAIAAVATPDRFFSGAGDSGLADSRGRGGNASGPRPAAGADVAAGAADVWVERSESPVAGLALADGLDALGVLGAGGVDGAGRGCADDAPGDVGAGFAGAATPDGPEAGAAPGRPGGGP